MGVASSTQHQRRSFVQRTKKLSGDYQGPEGVEFRKHKSTFYRTSQKSKRRKSKKTEELEGDYYLAPPRNYEYKVEDAGNYSDAADDYSLQEYEQDALLQEIIKARAQGNEEYTGDENERTGGNRSSDDQLNYEDASNEAKSDDEHIYSSMVWTYPCQPTSTHDEEGVDFYGYTDEARLVNLNLAAGSESSIQTASQGAVAAQDHSLEDDFNYYNQSPLRKVINNPQTETETERNDETSDDVNYINDNHKRGSLIHNVPIPAARSSTSTSPPGTSKSILYETTVDKDLTKLQLNTGRFVIVPFSVETSVGEFCSMMTEDYDSECHITDTDKSQFNKRIKLKSLPVPFIIEVSGSTNIVQRVESTFS